jgi:hypothetical protein
MVLELKKSKTEKKQPDSDPSTSRKNNIFSSSFTALDQSLKKVFNFDIEECKASNIEFFQMFEKHFAPEKILSEKAKKWRFKAMNLNKKIDTLGSHVLVIRSQYNEYRKSYEDLNMISNQMDCPFEGNQKKDTSLRKIKDRKIMIKYSDSRVFNRQKDCFLKINSKGLYIYQKFLCFEELVTHIPFDSITKIFYLKQHFIINSKKNQIINNEYQQMRKCYKIQFKQTPDKIECTKLLKMIIY